MLKSFRLYSAILLALGTGSLMANTHPAPGELGITGEFIYFMPSVDDTTFLIQGNTGTTRPIGRRVNNNFHFSPGFRVGATYALCDCDQEIQVDYLWLGHKHTKSVTGTNLWATQGVPDLASSFENYTGSALSHSRLLYERADLYFAQGLWNCCDLTVRAQVGAEVAFVRLDEHYTYALATGATTGNVNHTSRNWGAGPQIGFEFDYELYRCCEGNLPGVLSLDVVTSGSLLVCGDRIKESNITTVIDGGPIVTILSDSNEKSTTRIIPAFHTRIGFNYTTCLCDMVTGLEVGYEFTTYINGITKSFYYDDTADGLSTKRFGNFDVQGLYVNATVAF